jgi:hypothetical protein
MVSSKSRRRTYAVKAGNLAECGTLRATVEEVRTLWETQDADFLKRIDQLRRLVEPDAENSRLAA